MYCRNCGKALTDNAVICVSCGTRPLVGNRYCQNCGSEINPQAEFCLKCGVQLSKLRYAGFWLRLVAYLLDTLVLVIPVGILSALLSFPFPRLMLAAIINWLYFSLMESSKLQATLGKLALGLTVTDINGNRISFARATARHFAKIISGLTIFIGFILAGFTPKRQALHDIIADCLVIKKS
ncbi:MAG: RDD family protein [candidate division WOR-3 bacterium]